jgi:hypothetical protein
MGVQPSAQFLGGAGMQTALDVELGDGVSFRFVSASLSEPAVRTDCVVGRQSLTIVERTYKYVASWYKEIHMSGSVLAS